MIEQNTITVGKVKEFLKDIPDDYRILINVFGLPADITKLACVNNDSVMVTPKVTDGDKSTKFRRLKLLVKMITAIIYFDYD